MKESFESLLAGYKQFKEKYNSASNTLMEDLAVAGQSPRFMIVSCCDSRVDPALILKCSPGDLFIARNVANIIPPYENDEFHHGTSAALEYGVCYLKVKHLVILGHSSCGGVSAVMNKETLADQNDFIGNWVDLIDHPRHGDTKVDDFAKECLSYSYENCKTFPWVKSRLDNHDLAIHRWFFDIKKAEIQAFSTRHNDFIKLEDMLAEDSF